MESTSGFSGCSTSSTLGSLYSTGISSSQSEEGESDLFVMRRTKFRKPICDNGKNIYSPSYRKRLHTKGSPVAKDKFEELPEHIKAQCAVGSLKGPSFKVISLEEKDEANVSDVDPTIPLVSQKEGNQKKKECFPIVIIKKIYRVALGCLYGIINILCSLFYPSINPKRTKEPVHPLMNNDRFNKNTTPDKTSHIIADGDKQDVSSDICSQDQEYCQEDGEPMVEDDIKDCENGYDKLPPIVSSDEDSDSESIEDF